MTSLDLRSATTTSARARDHFAVAPSQHAEDPIAPATRARLARAIAARRTAIVSRWERSQFDAALIEEFQVAGVESGREGLVTLFLEPLADLLAAYVRTGESRYADVYLDERLRYAPFRAEPAVRAAFFQRVLDADERAVLESVGPGRHDADALHALLNQLHRPLRAPVAGPVVRILAVGDCVLNELRVFLAGACRRDGIAADVRNLYFSATAARALDAAEVLDFLREHPMDLVALSFLTYEGIPAYRALLHEGPRLPADAIDARVGAIVGLMGEFMEALRAETDIPFLVHGVSGLPLTRVRRRLPVAPLSAAHRHLREALNRGIRELVERTPNAIFIDEAALAASIGLRACEEPVIPRSVVRRAFFHTSRFGEVLSTAYAGVVRAYAQLHRTKVLLVDFDETLWRGVMADGTVEHHRDRQRLLLRLKEAGILLVAVSKNDPANIRWSEMQLSPSDFALLKVGWGLKAESIRDAARVLDLGLDAMAFIDDNPAERAMVREHLPSVLTLDANDPRTWDALVQMFKFPNTQDTAEARSRTTMYQQQAARRAMLTAVSVDYPAMMAGLGLKAGFGRARKADLDRIAELVQRTNQFNTTTVRYGRHELTAMLDDARQHVYVCTLADRFGALGLVAVGIVDRRGGDAIVTSFVMSCRAMGFGLERLMLRLILDAEHDAPRMIGRLVHTERNTPARRLFADCGFAASDETEWILERGAPRPEAPAWFAVSGGSQPPISG